MKNYRPKIINFLNPALIKILSYLDHSQKLDSLKMEPEYPSERTLSFLWNVYFKWMRNFDYTPKKIVPGSNWKKQVFLQKFLLLQTGRKVLEVRNWRSEEKKKKQKRNRKYTTKKKLEINNFLKMFRSKVTLRFPQFIAFTYQIDKTTPRRQEIKSDKRARLLVTENKFRTEFNPNVWCCQKISKEAVFAHCKARWPPSLDSI